VVIGQAAQQGHGRVAMSVDQARHQQVPAQPALDRCLPEGRCLGRPGNAQDPAVPDRERVVLEDGVGRLHRQQPAGVDDLVCVLQRGLRGPVRAGAGNGAGV
jgi:hypothetical protein